MKTCVADANIFLRFILKDNPPLYEKTKKYFQQVNDGSLTLIFLPEVITEIVYVLQKVYKVPRTDITNYVTTLAKTPGIQIADTASLLLALSLYAKKNVDFVDTMIFATAKEKGIELISFDGDVKKLKNP